MEILLTFLAECGYPFRLPLCREHILPFIADVKDYILGLDFRKEFKIPVDCDSLTLTDNLTGLSTRQSLTTVDDGQLSFQVINNDFLSIENDRLRAIK